jgi:hypothetical protein
VANPWFVLTQLLMTILQSYDGIHAIVPNAHPKWHFLFCKKVSLKNNSHKKFIRSFGNGKPMVSIYTASYDNLMIIFMVYVHKVQNAYSKCSDLYGDKATF